MVPLYGARKAATSLVGYIRWRTARLGFMRLLEGATVALLLATAILVSCNNNNSTMFSLHHSTHIRYMVYSVAPMLAHVCDMKRFYGQCHEIFDLWSSSSYISMIISNSVNYSRGSIQWFDNEIHCA